MTTLAIDSSSSRLADPRTAVGLILRPVRGQSEAPLIPLAVGRHVIGSGPDAEVRLEIPGVEAQHAVLLVGPQRSVLKAFSRFTWVNDGVIRECAIKPGDRLCLGPVEFEVLKGKSRRRRTEAPASPPPRAESRSAWTSTSQLASMLSGPPAAEIVSAPTARREKVISELNAELLQQLSQLVERETVAAERERRLIEQSAQVEGRRRAFETRQAEIERAQAELARAEAEWRRRSAEVSEQTIQLRLERETLERERGRLSEESTRLSARLEELEERRSALAVREARLDEQQVALEQRAGQLEAQEQAHAAAVAQALSATQGYADDVQRLAEQKATLERLEEQLRQQQDEFHHERSQFESDRDKLFAERAHLASREVEFTELRRRMHEQEAELEVRERQSQGLLDQAHSQQSLALESASELAAREQRLVTEEAALGMLRRELDQRKREIDEQHAAWMLERHTVAARTPSAEDRAAEHAAAVEVELLRRQVSELQARLREERGFWQQERAGLAAQAAAAEESPASIGEPGDPEMLAVEIAQLQHQLEAERARYQQERDAWEAEQDLILRDRQALEAEWRRLEARADREQHVESASAHAVDSLDHVPPPIPEQFLSLPQADEAVAEAGFENHWSQSAESAIGFPDDGFHSNHPQDDEIQAIAADWDGDPAQFADEASYGSLAHAATEYGDSADASEAMPHALHGDHAGGGDVLSLRAQLAELFGIQATEPSDEPSSEPHEPATDGESPATELLEEQPGEFGASEPTTDDAALYAADDEPESTESDADIMSAYLARLLKKSPDEVGTLHSAPVQAEPDRMAGDDQNVEPAPEPQKPARRLNAEEKETLRANLDSFRELANQQARAAVAKHKSNELKNGMQMTSVVAVLVTVVGVILVTAEFWSSQSYRIYGLACLAVAGAMGVYTLINGMRIRRLKTIERAAAELTEALDDDDEEQPAANAEPSRSED